MTTEETEEWILTSQIRATNINHPDVEEEGEDSGSRVHRVPATIYHIDVSVSGHPLATVCVMAAVRDAKAVPQYKLA